MYNGIGLPTARGSGTSGHIQKNLSQYKPRDAFHTQAAEVNRETSADLVGRKPDAGILDHERKRKIEVRCLELRDELEDQGVGEEDIETQVDELRQRLMRSSQPSQPSRSDVKALRPSGVHAMSAAKSKELETFGRALRINANYIEGQAWDKEVQEQRRMERLEAKRPKAEKEGKRQTAWTERREEMIRGCSSVTRPFSEREPPVRSRNSKSPPPRGWLRSLTPDSTEFKSRSPSSRPHRCTSYSASPSLRKRCRFSEDSISSRSARRGHRYNSDSRSAPLARDRREDARDESSLLFRASSPSSPRQRRASSKVSNEFRGGRPPARPTSLRSRDTRSQSDISSRSLSPRSEVL